MCLDPAFAGQPGDTLWNAPDRGAKVSAIRPGQKTPAYTPETFLREWTDQQVARWNAGHPVVSSEDAYREYSAASPTDSELTDNFPTHISPFGRVRSGKVDADKAALVLINYCPFCEARTKWTPFMSIRFDPANPYRHATTSCCKTDLYATPEDAPAGYSLKPTGTVTFLHLNDTWRGIPVTVYRDKHGVEWELFIKTIFDQKRWLDQGCNLVRDYGEQFRQTANPVYAHKIAVILDQASDTFYGLPLAFENELANGKDGNPLTRAEWEAVPRPAVFELSYLGPWNKRDPMNGSRGWLNMLDEHIWVEPFARVRHHPAFKHYSQKKYGDPDALDRKIMTKMMRELSMMFQSVFAQKLLHNYQDANYAEMWMLGVLLQDRVLLDFTQPTMEVSMYNHAYHDGLVGEGSPDYMAMPLGYYYPYLKDPNGWLEFQPDFLKDNPFYWSVTREWSRLGTLRDIGGEHNLEFADSHIWAYRPFNTNTVEVAKQEKVGSRNWAGYGTGVIRVGGPGHRQEVGLTYPRATHHGAQDALGIECWVDGVPVMRRGGYSAFWDNLEVDWNRPEYQVLKRMSYPHEMVIGKATADDWTYSYPKSPICQNGVMVDHRATGIGWEDNRGYGEVITFKGGEPAGAKGSQFQVLDVKDHYSWQQVGKQVQDFRRTLIGVEGPDGRPYVLDMLQVAGGDRHTLYNSAWAERAGDNLPALQSRAENLGDVFFGSKQPTDNGDARDIRLVRKAEKLAPPAKPWDLTWKSDFAAYAPRELDGTFKRPIPDEVGKVRLRMLGLPQEDGLTKLIRAKGPWNARVLQELPNVPVFSSNVGFMDARDFLVESRASADGRQELDSVFVHVLEGYREGERSVIKSVTHLKPVSMSGGKRRMVAVKIAFADGRTDTVIYQSEPGVIHFAGGIQTDARYALVRADSAGKIIGINACRGTYLKAGGFSRTFTAAYTGSIVDIIGDVTGTRQESALIIRPEKPWPAGNGLQNRQLLVKVTSALRKACNEGYRVEKVTQLSDGLIRVDLQDAVPFVTSWHEVSVLPEGKPNELMTARPMSDYGNSPWYRGLNACVPRKREVVQDRSDGAGRGRIRRKQARTGQERRPQGRRDRRRGLVCYLRHRARDEGKCRQRLLLAEIA